MAVSLLLLIFSKAEAVWSRNQLRFLKRLGLWFAARNGAVTMSISEEWVEKEREICRGLSEGSVLEFALSILKQDTWNYGLSTARTMHRTSATRYLTRPAQVGSRRGPVCKRDTVSSPISFVVTREGLEGGVEDNWVVFRVCTLKNEVSEALCVSFSNVEILCSKTLTLLFKF
jgi:hypothetical protein